jgi:hypothetical protein
MVGGSTGASGVLMAGGLTIAPSALVTKDVMTFSGPSGPLSGAGVTSEAVVLGGTVEELAVTGSAEGAAAFVTAIGLRIIVVRSSVGCGAVCVDVSVDAVGGSERRLDVMVVWAGAVGAAPGVVAGFA